VAGDFGLQNENIEVEENTASGEVLVTIVRTGSLEGTVQVIFSTVSSSAVPGADYVGQQQGIVTFAPDQTTGVIRIPLVDDALAEGTERFSVVLESVENGTLTLPRTADISILDDEAPTPPGTDPTPETHEYFVENEVVATAIDRPIAVQWFNGNGNQMLVAQQRGTVLLVEDGQVTRTVLDLRDQVNFYADRGLMDIELDPQFGQAGHNFLYAVYVYDPPETRANTGLAGVDGGGNRAGRVSRFEVTFDSGGRPVIDRGSEEVLLGKASIWSNISGPNVNSTSNLSQAPSGIIPEGEVTPPGVVLDGRNVRDYITGDSTSHGPGDLEFDSTGALLVSIGDGASYNGVDVRAFRVQDIDNLSGKILRVDRETGLGLDDNPFYTGDAAANASKVYAFGVRNTFRFTVDTGSGPDGEIWGADVGFSLWEELNVIRAGANYGWPFYEGGNGIALQNPSYALFAPAQAFYAAVAAGTATPTLASYLGFSHQSSAPGPDFAAIIAGDIYTGSRYPGELRNDLFFTDFLSGRIYTLDVDDPARTVRLLTAGSGPVDMVQGPDGLMYLVNLYAGSITRLNIAATPLPPGFDPNAISITLSNASTQVDGFSRQNRADNFTLNAPGPGTTRKLTGTDLAIQGVTPNTEVRATTSADGTVSVDIAEWYLVQNAFVQSASAASIVLRNFLSADVTLGDTGDSRVSIELSRRAEINTGAGNDLITFFGRTDNTTDARLNRVVVNSGAGDDRITVSSDRDATLSRIAAGAGNDTVIVLAGRDHRIDGGAGDDVLRGGTAPEYFIGGSGNDTILGQTGTDTAEFASRIDQALIEGLDGGGFRITSNDGIDTVRGVETFLFNGVAYTAAQVAARIGIQPASGPVAIDDSASTGAGQPVVLSPLANDTSAGGSPLTISALTQGTGGVATLNPDGTVTFTADAGFTGQANFTYTVRDEAGLSDVGAVTVNVLPSVAAPSIVLSHAFTPGFAQLRTDSFTFASPEAGTSRVVTAAEMAIANVVAPAAVHAVTAADGTLSVEVLGAWASLRNVFISDPDAASLRLANFVSTDVALAGAGDSTIDLQLAKRGVVSTGSGNDRVFIAALSNGPRPTLRQTASSSRPAPATTRWNWSASGDSRLPGSTAAAAMTR